MMEVCLPLIARTDAVAGYLVGTYALQHRAAGPGGARPPAHARRFRSPRPTARGLALVGAPAPRLAHVHGAAAAGPAGQHPGAAHGQLARARPACFRTCCTALVTGHVDRAGVGAGGAGARQPPPPARRARPGRCAGLSQGHGGLAGHGPACARPPGPHHLCEPGVLRHGGLPASELVGQTSPRPTGRPSMAQEYAEPRGCACRAGSTRRAKGYEIDVHAQGRHALSGA